MIWPLLWALAARAGPEDALAPEVRATWQEGRDLERAGDPAEAATRYRAVWLAAPTFTTALTDLGHALAVSGDPQAALDAYGEAPYDADVVEARARLLTELGRDRDAATDYATLEQLRSEDPAPYTLARARATVSWDPAAAEEAFRAWAAFPGATWSADASATLSALFTAYRASTAEDRARVLPLLDFVASKFLTAATDDPAFAGLREELVVEDRAARLASAAPDALTGFQAGQLDRARAAFHAGDRGAAARDLSALLARVPRNPAVHGMLAEVQLAEGEVEHAEISLRHAMEFDPLDPNYPERLGDLLQSAYSGRRDVEAADSYRIARVLDPTNAELLAKMARIDARTRDLRQLDAAIDGWRRYLAAEPDGPRAAEARAIVLGAERVRPVVPEIEPGPGRPATVPIAAWDATWLAHAWAIRGNHEQAELAVDRALAADPGYAPALAMKARLMLDRPDRADRAGAMALYERSLAADPAQPAVLLALADLASRGGDLTGAQQLREQAAALGSPDATYLLARADYDAGRLLDARRRLATWFTGPTGDHLDDARALQAQIDEALRARAVIAGVVALGVIGLPVWGLRRRRAGVGLDAFLAASPQSFRDVARVASIIRHDVLKHHTAVLDAVAAALEDRDPEPARWIGERLYGERGAVEKFRESVQELEDLARLRGITLNLRHRDPVFGPLIAGFDRLDKLRPELAEGHGRRLAADLREISLTINADGTRALGALVRRLCLLPVDRELLGAAWAATIAEPAFHGKDLPSFGVELDGAVPIVRMFRKDLDDILLNVLRNALQASLDAGGGRVGIRVAFDEDKVTGIERVALRVRDDAPKRVTTAVIRGRYIERGLGLTVDLISKNAGSIRVEDEPGWSKAVVVRFNRVEPSEDS